MQEGQSFAGAQQVHILIGIRSGGIVALRVADSADLAKATILDLFVLEPKPSPVGPVLVRLC